jgi:hypothetical protein
MSLETSMFRFRFFRRYATVVLKRGAWVETHA